MYLFVCVVIILINKTVGIIEKINMGRKNFFLYKKMKVFC
jgi:hypothetical protein